METKNPETPAGNLLAGDSSPKILITRLSHIGDCVLTLPLVHALKDKWPAAHITWALESPTQKLLGDHPLIDQILNTPKGYLTKPRELFQLRHQLRAGSFDIVFDPQSLTKSSMLGWLSGAPTRIGLAGKWKKEASGWLNNVHVEPSSTHLADRTLELLHGLNGNSRFDFWEFGSENPGTQPTKLLWQSESSLAGAWNTSPSRVTDGTASRPLQWSGWDPERSSPQFSIPTSQEDQNWVEQARTPLGSSERFGILNPGGSWASKRWEIDRFAEVARKLFQESGLRWLVTWAGDDELTWAKQIVQQAGEGCHLAPPSTLLQWTHLAKQATLFLGCDTGPMHMAAAVGTRCVVLFGPTKSQDSGPYGAGHCCIQNQYQSGGAKQRRKANNDSMRSIEVADVVKGCQWIVETSPYSHEAIAS